MTTLATYPVELSVVFPVYNEAENIGDVLTDAVGCLESLGLSYEICVVDDGSVDPTPAQVQALSEGQPRIHVARHEVNQGYGAALRTGIAQTSGRHVLLVDGDGQFRMSALKRLWPHRRSADLVLGFRNPRKDHWHRRLAGWLYGRVLVRRVLGQRVTDVNCGFKLVARELAEASQLGSCGALISAELITRARLLGARVTEVGVEHFPRRAGAATGLLPIVAFRMVKELLRFRAELRRSRGAAIDGSSPGLRRKCDTVESAPV